MIALLTVLLFIFSSVAEAYIIAKPPSGWTLRHISKHQLVDCRKQQHASSRLPHSALQSVAVQTASSETTAVLSTSCTATLSLGRQVRSERTAAAVTRAEALTGLFASILSTAAVVSDVSRARAEGNADGLGVADDLLADCPSTPTCVSSQDDRPYSFMEPWAYEGSWEGAMGRLRSYLEFSGAKVVASSPRYVRVEFDAGKALPASVDDGEFYFTPGDALVQFRCSRRNGPTDFGANRRRMDGIRLALNFESIPVLRNRKRVFFFGESPVDSFGPSFGKVDPSVIYGDADPMSPPFETPSDALRERYGGGGEGADRPAWWGKPLAEAGGFADWRQPRLASC